MMQRRGYRFFSIGLVLTGMFMAIGAFAEEMPTRDSELFLEAYETLGKGYGYYLVEVRHYLSGPPYVSNRYAVLHSRGDVYQGVGAI